MNFYECVFIIKQKVLVTEMYNITNSYQNLILNMGGRFIKKEYWGSRGLAYIIKRNLRGHYFFFRFFGDNVLIKTMENDIKGNEYIIKGLITKVKSNKNNFYNTKHLIT